MIYLYFNYIFIGTVNSFFYVFLSDFCSKFDLASEDLEKHTEYLIYPIDDFKFLFVFIKIPH